MLKLFDVFFFRTYDENMTFLFELLLAIVH